MGLLEKIASSLGVGQDEIGGVLKGTLDRVDRMNQALTKEVRDGIALGLCSMLDELKAEDVLVKDTHAKCVESVKAWHRGPDPAK